MSRLKPYPQYKDSGVEWIGDAPEGWSIKNLKYICSCNDEVLSESTSPDYRFEYIDISSVSLDSGIHKKEEMIFVESPSRARRIVRKGDVVISTVRTYLKAIASIGEEVTNLIASTGFAVLRPKKSINDIFLKYAAQSHTLADEICILSKGISYPAINADELINIPLPLPPVSEQQSIAAYLDRRTAQIDALITKKTRSIELLKEKRQAMITHAVTKGLNPNAKMKDSGVEWIGEVPEGWKIVRLKNALKQIKNSIKAGPFGSHLKSQEMNDSAVKVYNQRTVIDRDFVNGENFISFEKYEELKSFTVISGDILITTRGTIAKCAVVPDDSPLGILHPCLIRLQLDHNIIQLDFFIFLFEDSVIFKEQLAVSSAKNTIDVVYTEPLCEVIFALPPLLEQRSIAAYLDAKCAKIDTLIAKTERSIELLKEQRQALITAAVTGKIDVREAVC